MFPPGWRSQALERLDETFDLLIVGGGITGCGVLLDAAQRGLSVLLLERGDFASGTSSRSSKLIHGGLRYLRQMQFRITRLASRERDRMVVLNPQLVQPIRFLYPANRGDQVPGWTVDLGLWMYDRLTDRPEKHTHLEPAEVEALAPGLVVENLDRALAYTDAMTDDARLTLAAAATGVAYGGLAITRAAALEPLPAADGRIGGVAFRDLESGRVHRARAHLVVNATGVWVDELRRLCGLEGDKLRPSRGSHIVIPAERLPLAAALTLPSPDDGRPVFLIPHPEGVLAGTTDVYHQGPLDDPRPTAAEVGYILRAIQAQFPGRGLTAQDVVAAYAGLRPILDSHTDNPSEASREEEIWEERGLLSVAGGKLTTWRPTAEETVDEALNYLPEERARRAGPCYTAGTPLAGLAPADLAARLSATAGVAPGVAAGMARRLRADAWWAPQLARSESELAPLDETADLTAAEVRVHLRTGAVLRLEDLLLRRTRIGLWRPVLARRLVPLLEPLLRQELGWDGARFQREAERASAALEAWSPEGMAAEPDA